MIGNCVDDDFSLDGSVSSSDPSSLPSLVPRSCNYVSDDDDSSYAISDGDSMPDLLPPRSQRSRAFDSDEDSSDDECHLNRGARRNQVRPSRRIAGRRSSVAEVQVPQVSSPIVQECNMQCGTMQPLAHSHTCKNNPSLKRSYGSLAHNTLPNRERMTS